MNIPQHMNGNKLFWINKRMFDISLSLLLLPSLFIIVIILPFINYLLGKSGWETKEMMKYMKDLFKYHKFRMDYKNYKHNVVEQVVEEEEED